MEYEIVCEHARGEALVLRHLMSLARNPAVENFAEEILQLLRSGSGTVYAQ